MTYCNEFDPDAAAWLHAVFPAFAVDKRSIADVQPADVRPYSRCHFFAGIGGWEAALNLAGWPAGVPVWTGSCPCQPFSAAGRRKGEADERHLWPAFFRLIREGRPAVVMGEQVASKDGLRWLDGVCADLEEAGYATGAADLCAAGVNAPHIRQRLYWAAWLPDAAQFGPDQRGADGERQRCGVCPREEHRPVDGGPLADGLRIAGGERRQGGGGGGAETRAVDGVSMSAWSDYRIVECRDRDKAGRHKYRRLGTGIEPLAHGVRHGLGALRTRAGELGVDPSLCNRIARLASAYRRCQLRGYGNAIVPQVAAKFIEAVMEEIGL